MTEIDIKYVIGVIIGFIINLILDILTDLDLIVKIIVLIITLSVLCLFLLYEYVFKNEIKLIIKLLEKYEEIKTNEKKEVKYTQKLEELAPKLMDVGFRRYSQDYIGDNNYELRFTRGSPLSPIHQFLIRKLTNGKRMQPDEAYYSEKYPQQEKDKSDIHILNDFIEYLKQKL